MEHEGYSSGHPWYYVLGGRRLRMKEIRADAEASGYHGYMARDIEQADNYVEPKRSHTLRAMRERVVKELARDVPRYRELSRRLARRREAGAEDLNQAICDDIHTNISLKHNHLFNDFAHLARLDDLLSKQGDLFSF